jgi:hypothetical protein
MKWKIFIPTCFIIVLSACTNNKRVQDIKRLRAVKSIVSPYKGESGIILEDQEN